MLTRRYRSKPSLALAIPWSLLTCVLLAFLVETARDDEPIEPAVTSQFKLTDEPIGATDAKTLPPIKLGSTVSGIPLTATNEHLGSTGSGFPVTRTNEPMGSTKDEPMPATGPHDTSPHGAVGNVTKPSRFKRGFQLTRAIILAVVIFLAICGPIFCIQLMAGRAKSLHHMSQEISKKDKSKATAESVLSVMAPKKVDSKTDVPVEKSKSSLKHDIHVRSSDDIPPELKKSAKTVFISPAADGTLKTKQSDGTLPLSAVATPRSLSSGLVKKVEPESKERKTSGKLSLGKAPSMGSLKGESKSMQTLDFKIEAKDHVLNMDPLMADPQSAGEFKTQRLKLDGKGLKMSSTDSGELPMKTPAKITAKAKTPAKDLLPKTHS